MLKRDLDDVGSSSTKRVRYEDDQTKSSSLIEYTVKSGALIATEKVNVRIKFHIIISCCFFPHIFCFKFIVIVLFIINT